MIRFGKRQDFGHMTFSREALLWTFCLFHDLTKQKVREKGKECLLRVYVFHVLMLQTASLWPVLSIVSM